MRILGIIPARGGSKGVPGKNSRPLAGKPLIGYSIAAAQDARLDAVIVSTDSPEIASIAEKHGLKPPFLRPAALARDDSTSLSVVQHALDFCEASGEVFDAVCLLQPTTPFREKGFVDRAISRFETSGADALVSVLPVPHAFNPHWVFEPDGGWLRIATGDKHIIPRRQELPPAYYRDGSIYLTKTEVVRAGSFFGARTAFIESDPRWHVNIDSAEDWERAETLARNLGAAY
jgi:N-acylneuraminate cytidylyltransferase